MFADVQLAARLDRTEADVCASIAQIVTARDPDAKAFVMPIAGGAAVYAGPGSPLNKVIGAAFGELPAPEEVAALEAAFAERGAALQVEVSTLANPDFHRMLLGRGYELRAYEHLLGCALPAARLAEGAPGVSIEEAAGETAVAAWVDAMVTGFASPDVGGVGGEPAPPREDLERWCGLSAAAPGFHCYVARVDHAIAGGGALRIGGGVAMLCGASTLPAFRRRGVQTTLLRARLAAAARAGCHVAMVTTQPGSKSQQNVQREGFSLLYSRTLFVKTP